MVAAILLFASGLVWSWAFGLLAVYLAALVLICPVLISRRIAAVLFALMFLSLGVAAFARGIHAYLQQDSRKTWLTTRGFSLSPDGIGGRYSYRVSGTLYLGHCEIEEILWTPFELRRAGNQLRDDMRRRKIVVMYDPLAPSSSYLKVAGGGAATPIAVGALSLLIACALIGDARRRGFRVNWRMSGSFRRLKKRKLELDHVARGAVRGLMKRLQRREAIVVCETADGERSGKLDEGKAVPVLIEALSASDLHVRYSAAEVLGRMGVAAAPAIPMLKRMVGCDPQPGDRPGEALARMGAEGVETLIELLRSDEPPRRAAAALALRRVGTDCSAAAEALVHSLDDTDAVVRQHAAGSLGELGLSSDMVIASLHRRLGDPSLSARHAARKALTRLSHAADATLAVTARS
jgi:hypothetical protein